MSLQVNDDDPVAGRLRNPERGTEGSAAVSLAKVTTRKQLTPRALRESRR